jgi:hypothetical protein
LCNISGKFRFRRDGLRALAIAIPATVATLIMGNGVAACSHEGTHPPSPAPRPTVAASAEPVPAGSTEAPTESSAPPSAETTPYRASINRHAELYLPPWFAPSRGGYDLIVHFHGEGKWQEANVAHAHLNVAIVSINMGAGTEPYANAFKKPGAFDQLLEQTQTEITKSGRANGAQLRRIALSAWSAGFSSIAKLWTDAVAERVDAVLLADGFFTFFTKPSKRELSTESLAKFAKFAEAAHHDDKLFVITHTTIPTGPYPSVQECVTKLLQMVELRKKPARSVGPRDLHQFYVVDEGSFHVRGFEGTRAKDHVKQLHAMGETEYPLLKARWDKQDAEMAAPKDTAVAAKPAADTGKPRSAP